MTLKGKLSQADYSTGGGGIVMYSLSNDFQSRHISGHLAIVNTSRRESWWKKVLSVAKTLLLLWMFGAAAIACMAYQSTFHVSHTVKYTVGPGDTEWSIAQRFNPNVDPRKVIDAMDQMNGIADAQIQPGQVLTVPVGR